MTIAITTGINDTVNTISASGNAPLLTTGIKKSHAYDAWQHSGCHAPREHVQS